MKPHTTNLCNETDTKSTNTAINVYKNHGQPHNTNPHLPRTLRDAGYHNTGIKNVRKALNFSNSTINTSL